MDKKKHSNPAQKNSGGNNKGPGKKFRGSASNGPKPGSNHVLFVSVVFIAIAFILYGRTLDFGYVLDDQMVITGNQYTTRGVKGIGDLFAHETFEGYFKQKKNLVEGGRYRPLSLVTFAIEWSLFAKEQKDSYGNTITGSDGKVVYAGNPHAGHFFNILLYALTGIVVCILLFRLMPPGGKGAWLMNVPVAGGLIFLLHPVHIEAVANIKGRDEIMALLGSLLALYYALRGTEGHGGFKKNIFLAASGLFFFLGLLSKENAITFLVIIPLAVYFFSRAGRGGILKATIPSLVAAALYALMRFRATGVVEQAGEITNLMNNPFFGMTMVQKLSTVFYTLGLYLKLLFFPHPLTSDYMPYHIPVLTWTDYRAFLPFLAYVSLALVAWKGFRQKTIPSFAILYFLVTLSVMSNLVFSVGSFMNERFLFMPSLAFCILAAWFIMEVVPGWLGRGKPAGIAAIVMIVGLSAGYSLKTWIRVPDWKDQFSLNRSAVRVSANSARANCFMGVALFENEYLPGMRALAASAPGKDPASLAADTLRLLKLLDSIDHYLQKALRIYPEYASALATSSGIATEFYKLHRYDEEQLLSVFDTLIHRGEDLPFIREVCAYLNGQVTARLSYPVDSPVRREALANARRLKEFYLRAYGFFTGRGNADNSLAYIRLAAQVAPDDPLVQEGLRRTSPPEGMNVRKP